MKLYNELSKSGRIRRMRMLALEVLKEFGVRNPELKFVRQAGNTLFRVITTELPDSVGSSDIFVNDHFLLRIHQPGYQEPEAIELELAWLFGMRKDTDLPVQEPVPSLDGHFLIQIIVPGVPETRYCSLLRWINGRSVKNNVKRYHFLEAGRLFAKMHNFSSSWNHTEVPSKRRFDWEGLFQNDAGSGMTNGDAWALLIPEQREAFSFVAEKVREVMDDWGQNSEKFGLIHGDLGVDENLLFWHGKPRAIDFDDSGYGYYVFDLAVALDSCKDDPDYSIYKDELLRGYLEYRNLSSSEIDQLDLFLAALEIYWNLWATGGTHLYPEFLDEYKERIASTADFVIRFAQRIGAI